jgi:hypothetical protein
MKWIMNTHSSCLLHGSPFLQYVPPLLDYAKSFPIGSMCPSGLLAVFCQRLQGQLGRSGSQEGDLGWLWTGLGTHY